MEARSIYYTNRIRPDVAQRVVCGCNLRIGVRFNGPWRPGEARKKWEPDKLLMPVEVCSVSHQYLSAGWSQLGSDDWAQPICVLPYLCGMRLWDEDPGLSATNDGTNATTSEHSSLHLRFTGNTLTAAGMYDRTPKSNKPYASAFSSSMIQGLTFNCEIEVCCL